MVKDYISILASIKKYRKDRLPFYLAQKLVEAEDENTVLDNFMNFLNSTDQAFSTQNPVGHLTGSAFVVNWDLSKIVLTLHAKLKKWIQLGGHADGHPFLHEVALREAHEESGLKELDFLRWQEESEPCPFDFTIHQIPSFGALGPHLHYDVSYIFVAKDLSLIQSIESTDLAWFSLQEAYNACAPDMHRQLRKLESVLSLAKTAQLT